MAAVGYPVPALVGALLLLVPLTARAGLSASTSVPASNVYRMPPAPITANTLKPAACSAITLTTIVIGVTGTAGNDLVLGTALPDTISAGGGNDCVLAGGGADSINCGTSTDVALGGPGTDTFNANCETQVQ